MECAKNKNRSEYLRKYREANKEKYREYSAKYYQENKEKYREYGRKYREANKEYIIETNLKYREENKEKLKKTKYKSALLKYGITLEDYNKMLSEQGGVCAICGKKEKGNKRLAVDHDHDTGKIRGLLCGNCNIGLGSYNDDPATLIKAASYLRSCA